MDKGQAKRAFFAQGQTDNKNTIFLNFRDKKTCFLWWSNNFFKKNIRIWHFDLNIFFKSWLLNALFGQVQTKLGLRIKLRQPCSKMLASKFTVLREFRRWSHIKKPVCPWLVPMDVNAINPGTKGQTRTKGQGQGQGYPLPPYAWNVSSEFVTRVHSSFSLDIDSNSTLIHQISQTRNSYSLNIQPENKNSTLVLTRCPFDFYTLNTL